MKRYSVGIIGLGSRGGWWCRKMLPHMKWVKIVGLCDVYQDRIEKTKNYLSDNGFEAPTVLTQDYHELIDAEEVEVVLVFSSWKNHIESAIYAMNAGKPVAVEVCGASNIEQCWDLVRTYEKTKTPFMMLENCCFGKYELMALNMTHHGLFGEIVHCDGAYAHDLRDEITRGNENRHYRFNEYKNYNCENYPTHEIGPISKILNINNGNRFVSLVSMSSEALGLHEYVMNHDDLKEKYADVQFRQGDIVCTLIKCANGQTVSIKLDTTLPRYYCRNFTVRGTKGMYEEATQSVYIDGEDYSDAEWNWAPRFGNRTQYQDEWMHPIWKRYLETDYKDMGHAGHGGMDFLIMDAFFEALSRNLPMPVDVYDAATWMVISALTAQSIA